VIRHRGGRDALLRDQAWHVSQLFFRFSHACSRASRGMALFPFIDVPRRIARERVPTMFYGGSIPIDVQRRTRGSVSLPPPIVVAAPLGYLVCRNCGFYFRIHVK
jgi:hypothetical protein